MHIINNIKLLLIITSIGYISLASFEEPKDDIIGKWVSEKDSNWTIEFKIDGNCYWYYPNDDTDIFTYKIVSTSPQCGYQVKIGDIIGYQGDSGNLKDAIKKKDVN